MTTKVTGLAQVPPPPGRTHQPAADWRNFRISQECSLRTDNRPEVNLDQTVARNGVKPLTTKTAKPNRRELLPQSLKQTDECVRA